MKNEEIFAAATSAILRSSFFVLPFAVCLASHAQISTYDPTSARSVSGQFVVHVERSPAGVRAPDFSGDPEMLRLEASLLTVSAERIKQTLANELADKSAWRGKIYFSLHTAVSADEEIALTTERFKDGWAYRLDLPNPVRRTRFVRAVVQALIQERVNRSARVRSAEIPLWLSEGLTQIVLASRNLEIILPPPRMKVNNLSIAPVMFETRRTNVTTLARLSLGENGPISLDDLSWPKENQLAGTDADAFSHSAELFVADLLRFEDGRECFNQFLDELPNFLNWQTAFLRGFRPHFKRQLDLEKWWTLQCVSITGRDPGALWTSAETWEKLQELIPVRVQARRNKSEMPVPGQLSIGTVIREWDLVRQTAPLRAKLMELNLARQRASEDFLPLLDEYRNLLREYLEERGKFGITSGMRRKNADSFAREIAKRFDALDERRRRLRPEIRETAQTDAAAISQPYSAGNQ